MFELKKIFHLFNLFLKNSLYFVSNSYVSLNIRIPKPIDCRTKLLQIERVTEGSENVVFVFSQMALGSYRSQKSADQQALWGRSDWGIRLYKNKFRQFK